MKIGIISDLHYDVWNNPLALEKFIDMYVDKVDTIVFAGDIVYHEGVRDWCKSIYHKFKNIVIVLGNHDYWDVKRLNQTALQNIVDLWRDITIDFDNIHVLFNNDWSSNSENVHFVGGTYFTPLFAHDGDVSMHLDQTLQFQMGFNDFKYTYYLDPTTYTTRHYEPSDFITEYYKARDYLKDYLETNPYLKEDSKVVVVTHFAPSRKSIHKKYKGSRYNCYWCADDDKLIKTYTDKIKLWIHGHTHTPFDYKIANTRVVCNPVGYPNENELFNPMIIEV